MVCVYLRHQAKPSGAQLLGLIGEIRWMVVAMKLQGCDKEVAHSGKDERHRVTVVRRCHLLADGGLSVGE